jgi:hypothetical protein
MIEQLSARRLKAARHKDKFHAAAGWELPFALILIRNIVKAPPGRLTRSIHMPQYTIMLTDFGESDWEPETQVLHESGLDVKVVRLATWAPEQLIPQVSQADALIVQWASIDRQVIDALQHC